MLFTDLLSLHLFTFLMYFILVYTISLTPDPFRRVRGSGFARLAKFADKGIPAKVHDVSYTGDTGLALKSRQVQDE